MFVLLLCAAIAHEQGSLGCGFHRVKGKAEHKRVKFPVNPPPGHKSNHSNSTHWRNHTHRGPKDTTPFEPIRIQIDYRYLNGSLNDSMRCDTVGQKVRWDARYTCTSEDILSQSKINAIIETLENVKKFVQELLYVQRLDSGFYLENFAYYTDLNTSEYIEDTDMHFTAVLRPYGSGSTVLASAGSCQLESRFYRPIQGVIFINPAKVSETPSDYDSWNNNYFYVILHEMCHAFGISPSLYDYYHPYNSIEPHENITCSFTKSGKTFTFLNTPQAHKFAVKHFGQKYFYGDDGQKCWSGIELEDGGGSGTEMSHPESRVYMSEMMVGINIQTTAGPFNRLTDVSMSFLIDSGNYEINWKMLQPIVWGNKESIDGNYISDFATGPAQIAFPEAYIYNSTYKFNSGGNSEISASLYSCPSSSEEIQPYCEGKKFYNILNVDEVGSEWSYDYMPFKFPQTVCKKGEAVIPGMKTCGEFACNGFESFQINAISPDKYNKQSILTCDNTTIGQTFTFKYNKEWSYDKLSVTCVDPQRFCRSVTLSEMKFTSNPFSLETTLQVTPTKTSLTISNSKVQLSPMTILVICVSIISFVGVIVIIVFVTLIVRLNKKRKEFLSKKQIKAQMKAEEPAPVIAEA